MSAHAAAPDRPVDSVIAVITVAWCAAQAVVRAVDAGIDLIVPGLVLVGAVLALPLAAMPT